MDINDFLIDLDGLDLDRIFEEWYSLLDENFSVWLINRFGDMFLVYEDGSVHMLDVGAGEVYHLADSQDQFSSLCEMDDNVDAWFQVPLVESLVAFGKTISEGQCYGFNTPPILGGEYNIQNVEVSNIYSHYNMMGKVATQAQDVPEGAPLNIDL